ncbi:hypothetical protein TWF102_009087 [Orbilia oligospora]|uniref:Uncharacterized protein n=1 Tax=Orbilia oligospora TaxID=2813651 RepID=A0A7C8JC15_ORBOL|nr:hypothetical protein TWF103_005977 [Orbilia oligospora]KAF3109817.1 hypothetical protein TWF102_009087 [Orbilia oligospora]KAF3142222.1 hypothetical protein TWF594_005583 [Orbilia oligospora]
MVCLLRLCLGSAYRLIIHIDRVAHRLNDRESYQDFKYSTVATQGCIALPGVLPSISLKNIVLHPKLAVHNLHFTIASKANLTSQVFLLTGSIPSTMEQIPNRGENFAWDVLKTVTGDVISKVLVVLALIIYARLITGRWPLALPSIVPEDLELLQQDRGQPIARYQELENFRRQETYRNRKAQVY